MLNESRDSLAKPKRGYYSNNRRPKSQISNNDGGEYNGTRYYGIRDSKEVDTSNVDPNLMNSWN